MRRVTCELAAAGRASQALGLHQSAEAREESGGVVALSG